MMAVLIFPVDPRCVVSASTMAMILAGALQFILPKPGQEENKKVKTDNTTSLEKWKDVSAERGA